MCDAGTESRKVGGARPDRQLARRRLILTTLALRAAPAILVAVLLHALAFVVWDVGSRPPSQLVSDVRDAFSRARRASLSGLREGLWRFALGWAFLLAGAMLMLSVTVVNIRIEFTVLEVIAILSGLIVEALIGPAMRAHVLNR